MSNTIHQRHIYLKEKRPQFFKKELKTILHPFGCFMYTIEPFPKYVLLLVGEKYQDQDFCKQNNIPIPQLLLRFRVSVCQPEDHFFYYTAHKICNEKFKKISIDYINTGADIFLENNQIVGIKDLYRTLIIQGEFKKFAYLRFSSDDLYPKFLKNIRYFNSKVLPEWIEKGYVK